MDLCTAIRVLDCSGSLNLILSRLTDEMLESFIADFNRSDYTAYALFAVRLASPKTGTLDTNLPSLKVLVGKTVHLVNLEKMRREGMIEVIFPHTIQMDNADIQLRVTTEGRRRLKNYPRNFNDFS